jgi:hypothetical protein
MFPSVSGPHFISSRHGHFALSRTRITVPPSGVVARDHAIISLTQGANPDVQDTLIGGKIGKHVAVGRNLGQRALWISEEYASRNQRGLRAQKRALGQQDNEDKWTSNAASSHEASSFECQHSIFHLLCLK